MPNDDIQAVAPDGSTHVFPGNTDPAIIDSTMKKYITGGPQSTDPLVTGHGMEHPIDPTIQKLSSNITSGPEAQGQDMLAHIAGQENAPASPQDAVNQLKNTMGRYAGGEAALYGSAFAPSPATAVR